MELYWRHNEGDIKACLWELILPEKPPDIFIKYDYESGIGGNNNIGWEFITPDDPCRGGIRKRKAYQSDAKTYRMGVITSDRLILSGTITVKFIHARDRSIDIETTNVRATLFPGRDVNVTLPPVIVDKGTRHPLVIRLHDNYPNGTKVIIQARFEQTLVHEETHACVKTPYVIEREILPSGETGLRVCVRTDITAFPHVDIHQQIQYLLMFKVPTYISALPQCLKNDKPTHPVEVMHCTNRNKTVKSFHLYGSSVPVDWCDSFLACQAEGLRLAVAPDKDTQEFWSQLSINHDVDSFWVSAKRKDHGKEWTWLDEELTDCTKEQGDWCHEAVPDIHPYGHAYIYKRDVHLVFDNNSSLSKYALCEHPGNEQRNPKDQTWYDAMNNCAEEGSRLAVYEELNQYLGFQSLALNTYWVGLYYRPWIWVKAEANRTVYSPVLYSSWTQGAVSPMASLLDACLAINVNNNNQWETVPCTNKLSYFLCEGFYKSETTVKTTEMTETSITESGTGDEDVVLNEDMGEKDLKIEWIIGISSACGISVVSFIAGIIIGYYKYYLKRSTSRSRQAEISRTDRSMDNKQTNIELTSSQSALASFPTTSSSPDTNVGPYSVIRDSAVYKDLTGKLLVLPDCDLTHNDGVSGQTASLGAAFECEQPTCSDNQTGVAEETHTLGATKAPEESQLVVRPKTHATCNKLSKKKRKRKTPTNKTVEQFIPTTSEEFVEQTSYQTDTEDDGALHDKPGLFGEQPLHEEKSTDAIGGLRNNYPLRVEDGTDGQSITAQPDNSRSVDGCEFPDVVSEYIRTIDEVPSQPASEASLES